MCVYLCACAGGGGEGRETIFRRLHGESPDAGTDRRCECIKERGGGRDEAAIKVAIFCRLPSITRSVYRAYGPAEGHLAGKG